MILMKKQSDIKHGIALLTCEYSNIYNWRATILIPRLNVSHTRCSFGFVGAPRGSPLVNDRMLKKSVAPASRFTLTERS